MATKEDLSKPFEDPQPLVEIKEEPQPLDFELKKTSIDDNLQSSKKKIKRAGSQSPEKDSPNKAQQRFKLIQKSIGKEGEQFLSTVLKYKVKMVTVNELRPFSNVY